MKRGISLLLCLLLVLGISAFTTASAEDRVTLVYQTWNPGEDWFAAVEEDFEAKFPNIDVQHVFVPYSDHIQKLKIDLATGQGPDVFSLQTGATLKEFRDFEVKMNDLAAAEWGENWEDTIVSFAREVTPENGEYYGLPMGTSYAGTIWLTSPTSISTELEVPTNLDESERGLRQTAGERRNTVIGAMTTGSTLTWMNIANDVVEKLYAAIAGEVPSIDADLVKSFEI